MSELTVDGGVAAAARTGMVDARRAEHALLGHVTALDQAGVVAASGYRALRRLLEDLWNLDPAPARRLVTRAALLEPRMALSGEPLDPVLPATAAASAEGLLDDGHLRVIAATMEHLSRVPDLAPEQFAQAEIDLAQHATELAPAGLEKVARRIVAHLDPDGAAPADPAEPVDELHMVRRRDGTMSLAGEVTGRAEAELVAEVFDRLSAPAGPDDTRSLPQRRAEVLFDLCAQAASPTGIAAPDHRHDSDHGDEHDGDGLFDDSDGLFDDREQDHRDQDHRDRGDQSDRDQSDQDQGDQSDQSDRDQSDRDQSDQSDAAEPPGPCRPPRPTRRAGCPTVPVLGRALLAVTMNLEDLLDGTGHGLLDSGHPVTAATARRLACDAGIVPIVLGSRSEPLDVGRLSYSVNGAQRRALNQRDRGCSFPGCTRRPGRCHAHHLRSWLTDNGDTDLDNLTLVCRYHHNLVHHSDWRINMINGRPWYTPPAFVDPTRTPRPGGPETAVAG